MIAFFDMSHVNIRRYNSDLKKYFRSAIALVDDPELFQNDPEFKECFCVSWWTISRLEAFLIKKHIQFIIISGQRISDYRVIIAARKAGVKVIYKMHGLYVSHMPRSLYFFLSKIIKSIRFLTYLVNIGVELKSLQVPVLMLTNFIAGVPRKKFMGLSTKLSVHYSAVWSTYWKDWHQKNYGFSEGIEWLIIGNPDFEKFSFTDKSTERFVYIYQTLLEDGRISKKEMFNYYDGLIARFNEMGHQIYVKMHPRASTVCYKYMKDKGFKFIEVLPENAVYIGHYSSLLGLMPLKGSKVIIHELAGHGVPEAIKQIANIIIKVNRDNDLFAKLDQVDPCTENAERYFGGSLNLMALKNILDLA